MTNLTVQELIECGVHFGCRVSRWNPKMAPYIHSRRNQIHIIDLRETLKGIIRAQNLLFHMAAEGQSILWVGTKRQVKGVIAEAGDRTGMPIVTERWIGGTLTNFSVIRSRLRRLEELEGIDDAAAEEAKLNKKELSSIRREKRKITRNLGGIREMGTMPGAMVVVDPMREINAVREARKMGIVIIGLLDTDCDPSTTDIVIPGTDDALKSVRLMVEQLVAAVEEGSAQQREKLATMGVAQKRQETEMPDDEPRPTRGNRPPRRPRTAEGAGDGTEPVATETEKAAAAPAAPVAQGAPGTEGGGTKAAKSGDQPVPANVDGTSDSGGESESPPDEAAS
jgi:small subunit ribosomal protein S2